MSSGGRSAGGAWYPSRAALLAAGVAASLLLLLLLEGIVRIAFPEVNLQGAERTLFRDTTPDVGREWRPGARGIAFGMPVEIDENGCRAMSRPEAPESGWLILGDSVAFGAGVRVEQTFAGLIQRAHPETRVLNAGVFGMRAPGYPKTARRLLDRFPDIRRITLFYTLNDVAFPEESQERGRSLAVRISAFLRPRSKLYRFATTNLRDLRRSYFLVDLARYEDIDDRAGEELSPLLEAAALAWERDVEFEVVLLPYEYQLRVDLPEYWKPQAAVGAYLVAHGIPHRDARSWFDTRRFRARDYFLYGDPLHLNGRGHEAIARGLEQP